MLQSIIPNDELKNNIDTNYSSNNGILKERERLSSSTEIEPMRKSNSLSINKNLNSKLTRRTSIENYANKPCKVDKHVSLILN
jgi:hypothetical protein